MTVKANKFKIKNVDYEINAATLNDHEDSYFATADDVGDLTDLDTTDTSSIVDAINEVVDDVSDVAGDLSTEVTRATGVEGTLSSLTTTAQSNLVAAINEVDGHADNNATAIEDLAADISDAYSSSSTYKIGELCIRNNQLYRCTTAINTAEAWNSSHWTATTIADEIERIGFHDIIPVTLSGITALPKTFSVPGITADHKLIQEGDAYVSPRSSMADGWTLEASANQIRVLGTFSGSTSTTIIATMGIPNKTVTGVAQ